MTPAEKRKATIAARKAWSVKHKDLIEQALKITATGKCPQCGERLVRNLALAGWWQCSQYGAVGFRVDPNKPACSWQDFTV